MLQRLGLAGLAGVRKGIGQAFEEEGDRRVERAGDLIELRSADAVGAALVLLHLLEGDAELRRQRLLADAEEATAHSDADADMKVHRNGQTDRVLRGRFERRLRVHATQVRLLTQESRSLPANTQ